MNQRWTLHVENFGRIKSADIKIAPMMLFVGQNNTGKSYVASLLWGILSSLHKVFPDKIPSNKSYERCKELFISHHERKQSELDKELIKSVFSFINEFLKENKDKFIQEIFTSNKLEIGDLSIEIEDQDISKTSVEWRESSDFTGFSFRGLKCGGDVSNNLTMDERSYKFIQLLSQLLSVGEIGYPVYLPASRTGFMLSYKSLIASLMEEGWGLDKKVKSDFTRPIIDFLKRLLVDINREDFYTRWYGDIAHSLEKEILEGRIEQTPDPGASFYYQPELTKKSLPFHLTSSLVSELAPLIISLKGMVFNTLIFEEPESHLHLNAQRILAKYLVKLVNNGMPVWITTHSDIFFQQINNLIASNEQRIKKLGELSYKDDEMIKPGDIEAYQFNINKKGMTEVVPLEKTEDGFIVPTFNQTVMELSKETVNLETENAD